MPSRSERSASGSRISRAISLAIFGEKLMTHLGLGWIGIRS
jgi:hypothetical protein